MEGRSFNHVFALSRLRSSRISTTDRRSRSTDCARCLCGILNKAVAVYCCFQEKIMVDLVLLIDKANFTRDQIILIGWPPVDDIDQRNGVIVGCGEGTRQLTKFLHSREKQSWLMVIHRRMIPNGKLSDRLKSSREDPTRLPGMIRGEDVDQWGAPGLDRRYRKRPTSSPYERIMRNRVPPIIGTSASGIRFAVARSPWR
jgi:hypothetical protein